MPRERNSRGDESESGEWLIWDTVFSLCQAFPSQSPEDVLKMDALLAAAMAGAAGRSAEKIKASADGSSSGFGSTAGDGEWSTGFDGRRTLCIRSAETLRKVLKSQK